MGVASSTRCATMWSLAVALSIVAVAHGARFARATKGDGFLKVPVGTVDRPPRKMKRDESPLVTVLENMDFFYATDFEFGTPGQVVTVLVDTGSSELWVNPDCAEAPTTFQQEECEGFGFYDPDKSETPPTGPFGRNEILYGDASDPSTHTSVNFQYYTDTITLGDAVIVNQTFGVVTSSEGQTQGIFGLAPDIETGFNGADEPYSLVLHSMAEQGVIASRSFSLDLRHAKDEQGAIIYGGLDRNKFIGKLQSMPIIRGQQGEHRLGVELDSMGLTVDGGSSGYQLEDEDRNVMLDSGTTITRMHWSAAQPILEALGAVDEEGYFYTTCDMREEAGSVDFGFGNKIVRVPFSDFILDMGDPFYCAIGLVVTVDQQILGDSVLRAGYFVFDWDNEAVHIAQAANCGDEDIVAIEASVPDVTGNCDDFDALFTGGPIPTATASESDSLPTGDYTTTYTVTSCPPFDLRGCELGMVTTQTLTGGGEMTATGSAGDENDGEQGNSDEDADDAAGKGLAFSGVLLATGLIVGSLISIAP